MNLTDELLFFESNTFLFNLKTLKTLPVVTSGLGV